MSKIINTIVMYFLVRKWKREILANPNSEEVLEMAARTGNIRKLRQL